MDIFPDNQNVEKVFAGTIYYIDFYQRDYKWKKDQILNLLDDIFHKFSFEYKPDLDANEKNISEKYGWYYLNTFVTNDSNGKTYLVDGQQRLTSLTLFLIKLYHLANKYKSQQKEWIKDKILGHTAKGIYFWMGQSDRKKAFENLYEKDIKGIEESLNNLSVENIYKNYETISTYIDNQLDTEHKFETFTLFFMRRLVLINLSVAQTYVPMVFEVINDRGEKLKPYEILKGKLLGQIDKNEVEEYNKIWEDVIHRLQTHGDDQIDYFFRLLFRARYVNSLSESKEFDGDYHKTIFVNKWNNTLKLKWNPVNVKNFIKKEFSYYVNLYIKLLEETSKDDSAISEFLLYNSLNDQDRQYLLILSACSLNEVQENEKIKIVSKLFDKYFTLLNLNGCYDSNNFTESVIYLNVAIRDKSIEEIKDLFNNQLLKDISSKKAKQTDTPFIWTYFKDAGYTTIQKRFLRYLFARVEHFISKECNMPAENYNNLVLNTGQKNGYHIEHNLAHNKENLELFDNNEELFERERNRLGGLVLLKGKDNLSSGSERYVDKLKTYAGTNVWNQTLLEDFYHKKKDFEDFNKRFKLNFKPIPNLNKDMIEERSNIMFNLVKIIWN
ncbi:MAG: DUF262 domain-containing protein [Candidatus Methanoperedenaceae archaeon]|nr:DUF262 domain-containing protein [Candidatus Methanoperedenaceae archaeon]